MTGQGIARIIDGKAVAEKVRSEVAREVAALKGSHGITPGLAVVIVGEDPASQVYVRNKGKQTTAAGMKSVEHKLPASISELKLLELVGDLNRADDIHGILVQLPLPKHIDAANVIEAIDPDKDVDGFHPVNVGRLSTGVCSLVPCTPAGCMILAKTVKPSLEGLDAIVIGRSNIVGKPLAQLLLAAGCTVTIAHSKTRDLASHIRRADLVMAAVGRPEFVRGDWIKPGAIVIDVGINRVAGADGRDRLVGDVAFEEAVKVAGVITPVPGGVGPMTIACLLRNTLDAARAQVDLGPLAS
jgi:methylenetetrahydrofolate dehydrogenase (NADP+) / methenyltetrahydrofolate cyclohydrolase